MSDLTGQKAVSGNIRGVLSEIHPVYKIDTELNKEGYAADAKATGDAINGVSADLTAHKSNKNNPHGVTAAQVGARPDTWTPKAADVGALPITGGTLNGSLNVGGNVYMESSNEGGNVRIYPPSSNTHTNYWEMDSYNGSELRIYANKKGTNPNGSGNAFPLRLLTDGSLSTGNNAKTRKNLGVAPATESNGSAACYYRTVDGVDEWINPPMTAGVEYRTTERYNGKPVYVKLVNFGTMPNNTQKSISVSTTGAKQIIYAEGIARHSGGVTHVPLGGHLAVAIVTEVFSTSIALTLQATTDFSSWSAMILLKYVK